MRRWLLAGLALLAACDCNASHGLDAGHDGGEDEDVRRIDAPDASEDAGGDSAVALPPVTPESPGCDELDVPDDRACIEHGWFAMARWSTMTVKNGYEVIGLPRPRQPVFLETFLMDRTEVTVDGYRRFVAETTAEPLPERCGYENEPRERTIEPPEWLPEVSEMVDARADHPVVCVTRAEAASFCEWRGGRLPAVAEWMRAGQEPYPAFRRFPWGDSPPPPDDPAAGDYREFQREYLAYGLWDYSGLHTVPAGSRRSGAGPSGVLDLAGNASELLRECAEQLDDAYGARPTPFVRPTTAYREQCSEAVLVGGSNWASVVLDLAGSQTLWQMRDGAGGHSSVDSEAAVVENSDEETWGRSRPLDDSVPADGPGNQRRSWRVGFRCVYEP